MQVKGVLGNFFKKNIQNANQKKEVKESNKSLSLQSLQFQDDLKNADEVQSKLQQIKEKMPNNAHSFNAERASAVLKEEPNTGRLDSLRSKVLTEVMQNENKSALVNPKTWDILNKLRGE